MLARGRPLGPDHALERTDTLVSKRRGDVRSMVARVYNLHIMLRTARCAMSLL
jgi:hypothetical protein